VVDADGLNLIAKSPEVLLSSKAPIVITPHPGELSRIILTPVSQIQKERARIASSVAIRHKLTVVLKGYRTIVTDGDKVYENRSGNPGMATGGSGDVLTGMIATFLGQGFKPFEAASLGVYLHGLAGDLAAKKFGQISMIATDILDSLPTAITKFQRTQQNP
jgi:NAD(P)H-hydrate epimerase